MLLDGLLAEAKFRMCRCRYLLSISVSIHRFTKSQTDLFRPKMGSKFDDILNLGEGANGELEGIWQTI